MSLDIGERTLQPKVDRSNPTVDAVPEIPARRRPVLRSPRRSARPPRTGLGGRYWLLWSATSVSSLGDGLALVAFPLLARSFTSNPVAISGLLAAQRLPWLVCSLPLGAVADRVDRRRMTVIIEICRMVILALFAAALANHVGGLTLLYLTAFTLGAFEVGFTAAMAATVPEVVPFDQLARANGHIFAAQTAGEQFVGPALGGLAFAAVAALPFLLDGISFAVSAALLVVVMARPMLHSRRANDRKPPAAVEVIAPGTSTRPSLWADVVAGLRYLAGHRLLRLLIGLIAVFSFCQSMVLGVLVDFGRGPLHLGKAGYGLFLGVGAIGNVAAGTLAGRTHTRIGPARLLIAAGLGAAVGYLVMGATVVVAVAAAGLFIECLAVGFGNVASLTLRQQVVPTDLLGRTTTAYRMVVWGAIPAGALFGGALANATSLRTAFVAAGLAQLVLVVATAPTLARRIRDEVIDLREPEAVVTIPADAPVEDALI